MLSISPCAIVNTACTTIGMSAGRFSLTLSMSPSRICREVSISSGRFSMSVFATIDSALIMTGKSCGRDSFSVVKTEVKTSLTVASSAGAALTSPEVICWMTAGTAETIFWITGVMLLTIARKAVTTFPARLVISAPAFPNPAVSDLTDACSIPIEPEIVFSLSRAKFPAYCSVFSKNICIAT